MKWIAAAVLLCLVQQAAAASLPKPQRIMSLKICTDALLLDLVKAPLPGEKSRIASVTFLAQEPAALRQWPQAARLPVNHGSAEEILATKPDLILTDPYMTPLTRALLARTGVKVVEVPPAENFDQIRAVTRLVARAVGEEARGEGLIAQMDADLRIVVARRPQRILTVAGWGGGGYVPGKGGLFDAMLARAGARNFERGAFGYYDVESLIAANPEALVYGDAYRGTASLRSDQDLHPALVKRYAGRRITYASLYGCGVPRTGRVTRDLQDALLAVAPPRPQGAIQ